MKPRIDFKRAPREPVNAMYALEGYILGCGIEKALVALIKIRVSQINACAFCIDMHTKDARDHGETEQRIYALNAWPETPFFSDRERAALAWAEAVTRIGQGVHETLDEQANQHFSEKELADLTWAVVAINGWNRIAISFGLAPGSFQPDKVSVTSSRSTP